MALEGYGLRGIRQMLIGLYWEYIAKRFAVKRSPAFLRNIKITKTEPRLVLVLRKHEIVCDQLDYHFSWPPTTKCAEAMTCTIRRKCLSGRKEAMLEMPVLFFLACLHLVLLPFDAHVFS